MFNIEIVQTQKCKTKLLKHLFKKNLQFWIFAGIRYQNSSTEPTIQMVQFTDQREGFGVL